MKKSILVLVIVLMAGVAFAMDNSFIVGGSSTDYETNSGKTDIGFDVGISSVFDIVEIDVILGGFVSADDKSNTFEITQGFKVFEMAGYSIVSKAGIKRILLSGVDDENVYLFGVEVRKEMKSGYSIYCLLNKQISTDMDNDTLDASITRIGVKYPF